MREPGMPEERVEEIRAWVRVVQRDPDSPHIFTSPVVLELLHALDAARRERDEAVDRNRVLAVCYGQRTADGREGADDRLCDQRECARCWRKRCDTLTRERDEARAVGGEQAARVCERRAASMESEHPAHPAALEARKCAYAIRQAVRDVNADIGSTAVQPGLRPVAQSTAAGRGEGVNHA